MAGTKKSGNRTNNVWAELLKSPRTNKVLSPQQVLEKISWAIEIAETGICESVAEKDHEGARKWHNCLIQASFAHGKAYAIAVLEEDVRQLMEREVTPQARNGVVRMVQTDAQLHERIRLLRGTLEK